MRLSFLIAIALALTSTGPTATQDPGIDRGRQPATRPATTQSAEDAAPRHVLTPPVEPGDLDVPAGASLVHGPTGLVFPPRLFETDRVSTQAYNSAGTDLSAGYRDDESGLAVTIYLYPAKAPAAQMFEAEVRQIEQIWKTMERGESVQISDLGPPLASPIRTMALSSEQPAIGIPEPTTTYLALAEVVSKEPEEGKYLVKLRATVPTANAEDARTQLLAMGLFWLDANGYVAEGADDAAAATRPADGRPGRP